ncbi:hypothetical protein D6D27_08834 [Aureobasidium pullulans]|nr:hypothetical protein D6D27_08834 [Aureobasidium pullulans]
MASLLHILHPGAKTPSHSPSCTTSSYLRHKLSPPARGTHLLLLQHLKTTLTTASNLHHSLLFPSSSPAGMRSLSFMVASLFVSALTLSSASTQIHSYIFKLKKLPDPLTPLFAAVTTITANEDLSLVYEFKQYPPFSIVEFSMPCFPKQPTTAANLCHDKLLIGVPVFGTGPQPVSSIPASALNIAATETPPVHRRPHCRPGNTNISLPCISECH